jgi:hypothetical protein
MSTYNGRRAPNVSQYIANLNTIPAVNDTPTQQDFGNFDDDLTLFTNTQFFDFDMNEAVPNLPGDMGFGGERSSLGQVNVSQDGNKAIDFVNRELHLSFSPHCFFPDAVGCCHAGRPYGACGAYTMTRNAPP